MNPTIPKDTLDPLSENDFAKALIGYLQSGTEAKKAMAKEAVAHYLDIQGTGNFHHALSEELLHNENPKEIGERMRARVDDLQLELSNILKALIGNAVDSRILHKEGTLSSN